MNTTAESAISGTSEEEPRPGLRCLRGIRNKARMWRAEAVAVTLLVMLGGVLAASANPASAQSGSDQYASEGSPSGLMVEVTGTLERLDPATYGYGEYQITDEASGTLYALDDGDTGLLAPYVGQRVTVTGTEPAADQQPRNPSLLNVIQVEPAGEAPEGPGNTGSITFEVDTEGAVPQGVKFFGVYGEPTDPSGEIPPFGELGVVNLHDSDGDGTYVGVADVPLGERLALIAQGDATGPEEKIHPQGSTQSDVTITVDGNETVSTTASFPEQSPAEGDEPQIEVLPDTGGPGGLALAAVGLALVSAGIITASLRTTRRS